MTIINFPVDSLWDDFAVRRASNPHPLPEDDDGLTIPFATLYPFPQPRALDRRLPARAAARWRQLPLAGGPRLFSLLRLLIGAIALLAFVYSLIVIVTI